MVCVVINVCKPRPVYMNVKTPSGSFESPDGMTYLFGGETMAQTDGCRCNAVLDIYPADGAYADVFDGSFRADEVIGEMAEFVKPEILSMIVSLFLVKTICLQIRPGVCSAYWKTVFDDECPADLRGKDSERLPPLAF